MVLTKSAKPKLIVIINHLSPKLVIESITKELN